MIEDVLLSDIDCVHNMGQGNYMFKTKTRSYCLSTTKKFLMRFIKGTNGLSMTDDWFDIQMILSDSQYSELKGKLCI